MKTLLPLPHSTNRLSMRRGAHVTKVRKIHRICAAEPTPARTSAYRQVRVTSTSESTFLFPVFRVDRWSVIIILVVI